MDTGMVIMVIALVVVTLLGPVAGYFYAVRRARRRGVDGEARIRQLQDELRQARSGAGHAPMPQPRPAFGQPPAYVPRAAPEVAAQQPAAAPLGHQSASGPPTQATPPAPQQMPVQRHMSPDERFASEPPLFGDSGSPSQPPPQPAVPAQQPVAPQSQPATPQSQSLAPQQQHVVTPSQPVAPQPQPAAPQSEQPVAMPQPAGPPPQETTAPSPQAQPAAQAGEHPPGDPARAATPSTAGFTPVSDIIDASEARKMDWLSELSMGRRVRLQRLGYDAPEKLANLRRSEVRRLARELDVSEEVIKERWMPAAAAQLRARDQE
ncbi:MAG: hypothetical protein JJ896_08880 [Rhodothermales bacterium]|nr:hypothetical protein [Rhodothermales bacterium]MBO6779752.1 hypothetical protein [Rhodothermales bacterium]